MVLVTDANFLSSLRAAGSQRAFEKAAQTTEGNGTYHSLWKAAGLPAAGANPPLFSAGSGYVPTKATAGAYAFTNSATDGHVALLRNALFAGTAMSGFVYDRLWACSGFGTVVTTLQSVTTPGALPAGRNPNTGQDVHPYIEVYTAPGATGATWTMTGTDANGNTGRTWTYTHPANAETVGQMMLMLPGTAATLGCRQVDSFQCSVSSGTAGDVGITLARMLSENVVMLANTGNVLDGIGTGCPPVFNDSCVALQILCTASPTGLIRGSLVIGEGV